MNLDQIPSRYVPDGAADFFATLLAAIPAATTDVAAFYRVLHQTLRLAAEQQTAFHALNLGGLFAKVDYLCKEHSLPWQLRCEINAARTRSRYDRAQWRADLAAVCRFISAIYDAPIPIGLTALFPAAEPTTDDVPSRPDEAIFRHSAVYAGTDEAYCRVVAERWDADYIYARSEEAEEIKIALHAGEYDWSYLTKLLRTGSQLNLVRPRRSGDGVILPELIIYEPDYLVDVTSVAGCFETYSNTPFLHLLHKLSPARQSQAIMLGNLAGQLLDAVVHGDRSDASPIRPDGSLDITPFVRDNLLGILAGIRDESLHLEGMVEDARQQLANIRTALDEGLAHAVGAYEPARVILEPSFVSEMLGLQGRMDFLQQDHRVMIEQKSGKGGYNPGHPDEPRQQTKHYVQMLLYMAVLRYNFHEQYRRNQGQLHSFLLYSKYKTALLGLGPAPQLLHEALRVRNGLVWYEELYCQGGARLLERMTADRLNTLGASGPLWEVYQRPQLEALLCPIRQASPLERAYYFRMLQFVEQEHYISKVGNNTAQSNCFAAKWFNSLAEKRESGEISDDMALSEATPDEIFLSFTTDVTADTTNFRLGDIVIAYPYDPASEPDCRRTMIFRGNLAAMTSTGYRIRLRARQSDVSVITRDAHRPWAVEHDATESSFTGIYSGLHAFLSAPQPRRDLLLLQREPTVDESRECLGDYGNFNELQHRVKQAQDLFLIIGPPGTGKTSYGMLYTLQEQLREPGTNVLVLSYTNRAVDEICSKLVEEQIPFIRIGNPNNCEPQYHPYLLQQRATGDLAEMQQLIDNTRVFVGTTTTMSSQHALFQLKRFDLAIIDEASQILEPHLLGLLSETCEGESVIRKVVMIGDHKQLPAVVQQSADQSAVSEPELQKIGLTDCRASLFERLLRRYSHDPRVTFMLTHQGRMHRDIAAFASRYFYEGRLDVVPLPHQVEESASPRISFMPAQAPAEIGDPAVLSASDKVNLVEARIIADTVGRITEQEGWTGSSEAVARALAGIGIIVPYRNQIAAIRSLLPEALRGVTIDTVERYQGSQRDYIIYGFTIQKRYQLDFLTSNVFEENGQVIDRKLNVAMTRARRHLILVGNPRLLAENKTFARLLDYCQVSGN